MGSPVLQSRTMLGPQAVLRLAPLLLLGVVGPGQGEDVAGLARQASEAMRARDFEAAERLYRQLGGLMPDEAGIELNLGLALYSGGKYEAAIESLERFLEAVPDHGPAWLLVGMSHQKAARPGEAVSPLGKAVELDPENGIARLELADALLRSGQPGRARAEFSLLTVREAANPKAWLGLGLSCAELSGRAAAELERTAPDSAYSRLLLGRAAAAQGRLRAAFGHFRAAESIDPRAPGIRGAIAAVYEASGRPDWAAAELAKRGAPEPCGRRLPECWFEAGDYGRVIEWAERERTPKALYWSARAYAGQAEAAHANLLALPPSSAAYQLAASIEDLAGDPREAAGSWRQAVRLEPANLNLRIGLLRALRAAGQDEECEREARALLRRWPDSPVGRFHAGDALRRMGRAEESIPLLEGAVDLSGGDAVMRAALATAYLAAGRGSKAVPHLEAALEARGEDARLLFQLSRAYQAAGRREDARLALRRRAAAASVSLPEPRQEAIAAP